MNKLTLGILAFNNGKYLQELLNSVENQGDKDFSLLIINNNSTDLSQSIINNFNKLKHDYDIKILNNSKNYGSFLGTKQLILNTATSHVSIIHGDDLLKNNYVEIANKYINLYPNICAFNFDLQEIEDSGNISTGNIIKSNWTNFKIMNRLLVSGLNPGVMPGAIVNIERLGNNYLSNEFINFNLNGTEDIFLWQQIIRSSKKIKRIPVASYFYRRHSGQISKSFDVYGFSLGYARKVNFDTAKTKLEKLLCVSEITYEFSVVNYNESYLKGLKGLVKYDKYEIFRFLNIFIRRFTILINLITRS